MRHVTHQTADRRSFLFIVDHHSFQSISDSYGVRSTENKCCSIYERFVDPIVSASGMKRRVIAGLIVTALLVLLVALWPQERTPAAKPPSDLSVSFVAFSNTSTGLAAVFFMTNGTICSQHFQIKLVEHKGSAGWESAPPKPHQGLVGWLSPGKSFSWPVGVDITNSTWRIRVDCQEKRRGFARAVDRGKAIINQIKTGNTTDIFGGRTYEVVSSESK
jgi:hypothetical protein